MFVPLGTSHCRQARAAPYTESTFDMQNGVNMVEKACFVFFVLLTAWWMALFFYFDAELVQQNLYWAATYQLIAWLGGLFGIFTARLWGGFRSFMGQAIIFFSFGLILQGFGQTTFSVYTTMLGQELPYPSLADVGYFGSVIAYLAGIVCLARVVGAFNNIKDLSGKMQAIFIPLLLLVLSYTLFLRGYEFDWTSPLRIFLDFGYPLGEAVYVGLAILTFLFSYNTLGGIMRRPLTLLMAALFMQYLAEFNFLHQASNETWLNGGYGDFLYLGAYFLMTLSLVRIEQALASLASEEAPPHL